MEKTKLTTTKVHNEKKCTTTKNKHKKTKARFSRLLQHLAWKRRGPIVVLALHKFVPHLLRHLPTYLQPWDPHKTASRMFWSLQTCGFDFLHVFPISVLQ